MKVRIYILILGFFAYGVSSMAQSNSLYGYNYAYGSLSVNQDERLKTLLYKNTAEANTDSINIYMPGYRVQIYSNNNPRKAKTEAFNIAKTVKETFPQQSVHVTYTAPFWKVRMGDFTNYFEALSFAKRFMRENPKMAGEVFVMKEASVVPICIKKHSDDTLADDTPSPQTHRNMYYSY